MYIFTYSYTSIGYDQSFSYVFMLAPRWKLLPAATAEGNFLKDLKQRNCDFPIFSIASLNNQFNQSVKPPIGFESRLSRLRSGSEMIRSRFASNLFKFDQHWPIQCFPPWGPGPASPSSPPSGLASSFASWPHIEQCWSTRLGGWWGNATNKN